MTRGELKEARRKDPYRVPHCEDCKNWTRIEENPTWGVCSKARNGANTVYRADGKPVKIKWTPTRLYSQKACLTRFELREDAPELKTFWGKRIEEDPT